MLLQFSLDESGVFVNFSIRLLVHAFISGGCFSIPWCTVDVELLEQEGKRLSLEAEKKVKLHTPWG